MDDNQPKPRHLKSVINRDKNGKIRSIAVVASEKPSFHTPAYDELVAGNKIPRFLWKKMD